MKKYSLLLALLGCIILGGCKTTSWNFEWDQDGKLIKSEYMELKGVGKNKADHKNDKIENDSGFKVPFGDTSVRDLPMPSATVN